MKKDFSEKTTFYITISLFIGIFILPFISFFGVDVDELNPFNNGQKVEVIFETEEDTYKDEWPSGKDLVGYDWVYPDMNSLMAAWKFSGDGTFNVSQKTFGGSTRRGQWKDLGNGQVELIYDDGGFVRSGDGGSANVDARATITLLSKSQFQLGSTVYRRY